MPISLRREQGLAPVETLRTIFRHHLVAATVRGFLRHDGMTTSAALMGALPLAFGFGSDGDSRKPLGSIIVGGLIVSQVITLFITPVLFLYFEDLQAKVLDRVPLFRRSQPHGKPADSASAPKPEPVVA